MRTFSRGSEQVTVPDPAVTEPPAVVAYTRAVVERLSDGWTEVVDVDADSGMVWETYESGRLKARGRQQGDDKVGRWLMFRESGALSQVTERDDSGTVLWARFFRENGTIYALRDWRPYTGGNRADVTRYAEDGERVTRRAQRRYVPGWDGTWRWVDDGRVEEIDDKGKVNHRFYDLGQEARPPSEDGEPQFDTKALVEALARTSATKRAEALRGVLYRDADMVAWALERGTVAVDGETAFDAMIGLASQQRTDAAKAVAPHALDLASVLGEKRDALIAARYPEQHQLLAVLALWDALDVDALRSTENRALLMVAAGVLASSSDEAVCGVVAQALRTLPVEEREPAVLHYDTLRWRWAELAPTPEVIRRALVAVGKMKRKEFTYSPDRQRHVTTAMAALGPEAVPAVIAAWTDGGDKHPQRGFYALALAQSGSPEAVETLLQMAGDSLEEVRDHAVEGLTSLADEAVLIEALSSRKKAVRESAARALAAKPRTESAAAAAEKRLGKEKAPEVRLALEAVVALRVVEETEESSDAVASLRERAAALDVSDLDARVARLISDYHQSSLIATLARLDPAWVVVVADQLVAQIHEGSRNISSYGQRPDQWGWLTHVGEPEATRALAAEVADLALTRSTVNGASTLKNLHESLGDEVLVRLAARLDVEAVPVKRLRRMLEWWAEHAPTSGVPVFAPSLAIGSKPVRDAAVAGLIAAGAESVPAVWPLLRGKADVVKAAAQVLAAHPDPRSVAPLDEAIAATRTGSVVEALEAALGACRTAQLASEDASPADVDLAALDADLAGRKVRGVPKVEVPEVRWVDGTALSAGATKWLLATLKKEGPTVCSTELWAVRDLLEPASRAELLTALRAAVPAEAKNKWIRYARPVLGDAADLDALGGRLQGEVWQSSAAWASHGIEALKRAGTPTAIRWLDHWASHAQTRKLGADARAARADLAAERELDADALVDLAFVGLAGAEEAIVARLEAAMITGRRWPAEAFRTFVLGTGQADGLVGAVFGEGGPTTLFRIVDGAAVDLDGTPVALEGPIGVPHPVELTDAQLRAWAGGPTPSFPQLERPFTRDPRKASEALCAKGPVSAKTFVQRAEARGFQHGDPEDAGLIYSVRRRIGSWVLSIEHDGLTASGKRPVTGAKLKVRGPGFRSDDDSWSPPTEGLASEAHEDLKVLLA